MIIISTPGNFKQCENCKINGKCCHSFCEINSPCINDQELNKIKDITKSDNFFIKVDDNLFNLKTYNGKCIFYKNGKCSIYQNRPTDCKLFPFDIIKKNSHYYLILYLLDCYDYDNIQKESINLDNLIDEIITWIDKFTDKRNYTKMQKLKYKIIKEINLNK